MRKALNENPVVQVALIGVLAIVVGVLMITRMGSGSGSEGSSAPATSSAAATPAAETVAPESAAATPTAPAGDATAPTTVAASGEFTAGPGLPAKVVDAHDAGKAVVVLVVHPKGFDDRKLTAQIGAAVGTGNTATFVVPADEIADYSRIAEGVDVDRVPALIVIEPKALADDPGGLPEASVSYGYRGPESVAQAVRDALYKGREDLPYHPE